MTRDRDELAWTAFSVTFTREKHLPAEARGKEAIRAALRVERGDPETAGIRAAIEVRKQRATVPNNISDERARRIIAEIALKHDTTSADIKAPGGDTNTVAAREECAYELTRAGLSQRAVVAALGRKTNRHAARWVENHEERMAAMGSAEAKEEAHG